MQSTALGCPLPVSPTSLAAAFAEVPHPLRAGSVISPLSAILTWAVAALANPISVLAIAEWGARQRLEFLTRLGFPAGPMPCQLTLQRLVRPLDGDALAATLNHCFVPTAVPPALAKRPLTDRREVRTTDRGHG